MELGLKGRAAVITGGSRGIGKAIARGLAAGGVNLVLLARGKEQLEKAAEEIAQESGVQVLPLPADIANAAA
jgi:3-oxoacyl-[acyl-carrier protein] reductase